MTETPSLASCPICSKSFVPKNTWKLQVYCSRECVVKARKRGIVKSFNNTIK